MSEPNQHDASHITAENLTFRSSYAFQTLILAFTLSRRTAFIFIVLCAELVHLFTGSLKDMLNGLRFRLMRPKSDLNRLFHQMLFI